MITALNQLEKSNSKSVFLDSTSVLLRLLDNVLKFPGEPKYRTIRKENKIIKEKLLVNAMLDLLVKIGFEENSDALTLPATVNISNLKEIRDVISRRIEFIKNTPSSSSSSNMALHTALQKPISTTEVKQEPKVIQKPKPDVIEIKSTKSYRESITFPRVINSSNSFIQQIETLSDSIMQYEDPLLQESALKLIPLEDLKLQATKKLRKFQKLISSGSLKEPEPLMDELILEELTEWFKSNFFTWINKMPCKVCKNENTKAVGNVVVDGVRVEKYICCNTVTEFHRFNDIAKLLQTRSGRCGEWANCFTFLCRCLKYEARYIYSTSDHVWTEVFSVSKNRWVHVDPSENVIDSPLMYECGWNRKLNYILAFSCEDVQDVSWRYSKDHEKMLKSRNLCTEKELLQAILELRKKRQMNCSESRKKYLKKRTLRELVDLMVIREPTENERKGRSSGSLSWRLERGEGNANNFYVFNLLPSETQQKQFNLRYSCSKDVYERFLKIGSGIENLESKEEWTSLLYVSENIFRKIEHDWKINYLARTEGTQTAKIQWKFDFNLPIQEVSLRFDTKTYETGDIKVLILDGNDKPLNSINDLKNRKKFSIQAQLSGGKGEISWQHTQLFRQGKSDHVVYPFELNVKFQ